MSFNVRKCMANWFLILTMQGYPTEKNSFSLKFQNADYASDVVQNLV